MNRKATDNIRKEKTPSLHRLGGQFFDRMMDGLLRGWTAPVFLRIRFQTVIIGLDLNGVQVCHLDALKMRQTIHYKKQKSPKIGRFKGKLRRF